MSNLIRCEDCGGKKYVYSLGMMRKDCAKCKAIGWVEQDSKLTAVEAANDKFDDLPVVEKIRQRGRPKKVQNL